MQLPRSVGRFCESTTRPAFIATTGAQSKKDMGKVMKAVMPKLAGKNADGKAVKPHSGSIAWNAFRKRWVTVFLEHFGKPSVFGELWYAEADAPTGPWGKAVKVVSFLLTWLPETYEYVGQTAGSREVEVRARVTGILLKRNFDEGGRVTILVSHRFATVRLADRIAVVDGGRVSEYGTHDELLASQGRYARMFRVQSEPFDARQGSHSG